MSETLKTRINKSWLFKITLFLVVLLGFGSWGLFDALYVYPVRGEADASYRLKEYLDALQKAGLSNEAAVADPGAALAQLRTHREELASASAADTFSGRKAKVELTRLDWLESLSRVWRLKPARTSVEGICNTFMGVKKAPSPATDLGAALAQLNEFWTANPTPTPLSGYDLASQWLFVVIGYAGGLYLLSLVVGAARKSYRYDPAQRVLTLPGGRAIGAADLTEVDKTKWHKFYVTLVTREGAPVTLDLLRHTPLEDWVKDMEAAAFPEATESAAAESAPQSSEQASGSAA